MKRILLITFAALLVWSCGNKTKYTINGEIVPDSGNKSVIMHGFTEGNPTPIDTVDLIDGKFSFTGDVDIPELRLLSLEGERRYIAQIFVDASNMDMTIYPDSFQANVVVGSKSNDILQVYMDEMITFTDSENELKEKFRQAQISGDEEAINSIRFEFETMMENTTFYSKNFIKEYSESPVAVYVYIMNFLQAAELSELDSILEVFEPIKESDLVKSIEYRAESLRASAKGAAAPDFSINDPEGNAINLSDLKGKYVLIDFWASWCQPCMVEMPNVIANYEKYNEKGFEIIGVSLDRDRDAWLNTIAAKKMDWLHGWDQQGAIATKYGVQGIPHTVLLDKEGKIVAKNLRGPALGAKLAELLD